MPSLFGTDGLRGVANVELTSELSTAVARAAGAWFGRRSKRPTVVIGRDTRASGDLIESAVIAGLLSSGADVARAGVVPSPAVAFLTQEISAGGGMVISASHNPPEDNGIKIFGPDGSKLTEEEEDQIEALVDASLDLPVGTEVGRMRIIPNAKESFVNHLVGALGGRRLEGLRIVADCANGAAYEVGPMALERAGAEVIAINAEPDGSNINVGCGSTSTEKAAKAVLEFSADAGLAFDGDADRVVALDEEGNVVDGDAMIAALALDMKQQNTLAGNQVVITVMANLGLRNALGSAGIQLIETAVGDRYVAEAMKANGSALGGEQSGHVIFREHSSTGDGVLTGLLLLGLMTSSGRHLSELSSVIERYPQVLINVKVPDTGRLERADRVWRKVQEVEEALGTRGRVLVRASGTEPLVRVMVEASDEATASQAAESIVEVVREDMGGGVTE